MLHLKTGEIFAGFYFAKWSAKSEQGEENNK